MEHKRYILGVDVGGVIISREGDEGDTSFFSENYLSTPAVSGAMAALHKLATDFDDTVIISKCGKNIQEKTLKWMQHHHFYEETGIAFSKFHFCKTRGEKAGIAKSLGVNYYVDDRIEILESMIGTVKNLYAFRPAQKEYEFYCSAAEKAGVINKMWSVHTWPFLESKLTLQLLYDKVADQGKLAEFESLVNNFKSKAV